MRVLLVGTGVHPIPPTGYGGVERTISEFSRALSGLGVDVKVVNEVRRGRTRDEYPFAFHLPHLLRQESFDVVHASTPVVGNRLSWVGQPYVYTSHSRHWFEVEGPSQRFGFWLERRAVRGAEHTIALTDRLADRIVSAFGRGTAPPHSVIPIGVDADRFRPNWAERTGRVALGVGVVRPFKRWELAARALKGSGWRLEIVGPTPNPAYARTVVEAGGEVRLLGELPDVELQAKYASADLLVHPSRVELLAGVVLQGLAAGLPVLGAEPLGGIVVDGRTGFVARPGADASGVVETIHDHAVRLFGAPEERRRLGEAGRADALSRFSWPTVARAHLDLYEQLRDAGKLNRR